VTDIDTVDERLRAVERAISDGDADVELTDPTGELGERIEALEAEVADLDAAVQAIRGYVGHVRSVDESVEREADTALAAVDDLRDRVDRLEGGNRTGSDSSHSLDTSQSGERDAADRSAPSESRARPTRSRRPAAADGGAIDQRRQASEPSRWGPTESPAHCPYCHHPRHPPKRGSRASEPTPERDQGRGRVPSGGEGGGASEGATDPVEDVDEDGLVDRLRDSL